MSAKPSSPYQPLLLRLLHGLTSFFAIAAIITAFWTYDIYDGRWGTLSLPQWREIEGIHGTFGLWTLLVFPLFALYAFHRGEKRLIQASSLTKIKAIGQPIWWYTLHRFTNTLAILSLTFAVFSGKMMDETWLPKGELNHSWYYAHLISWIVLVGCIALHLLMSARVGGVPLLMSMLTWRFRAKDNPILWREQIQQWYAGSNVSTVLKKEWLQLSFLIKVLEFFVLFSIAIAWILPLF
ncbi:MAG: cytochrome b/b6 domain-containing protein [Halothece sp.]